jgi:acyl transferase domain-containing protein
MASLIAELKALGGADDADPVNWIRGSVKQNKDTVSLFATNEELSEAINKWIARGKYRNLLELWAKGLDVDWQDLYTGHWQPRRMSLPTYAFSRQRYWISETPESTQNTKQSSNNTKTTRASERDLIQSSIASFLKYEMSIDSVINITDDLLN